MKTDTTSAPAAHVSRFERALAEYLFARDFLNGFVSGVIREETDFAATAYCALDNQLIKAPAMSIQDLRTKFEMLWEETSSDPCTDHILALFEDLQRLTGDVPSQLFQPDGWLRRFEKKGGMYCVRDREVFLLTPKSADLDNLMFELKASGGREAVNELIRARTGMETNDG